MLKKSLTQNSKISVRLKLPTIAKRLFKQQSILSPQWSKLIRVIQNRGFNTVTGEFISPGQLSGFDHVNDKRLNKGSAFSIEDRQTLGIHGLIPAIYRDQITQVQQVKRIFDSQKDPLSKYGYILALQGRNERLYYRFVGEYIEQVMPIIYTPTVGLACQHYGLVYRRPLGIYITYYDRNHIFEILKNWPEEAVRAICVTDGERILGLGDLGSSGMGIPVGKLALYTALGRIKPHQCLPIVLDVGCNNKSMVNDPMYMGLRQKRISGKEYVKFVDEFMAAVVKRFGQDTLIQFEDFATNNAFAFLHRYQKKYCTFNDDIQGTASMGLAGILGSLRITKKKLTDYIFLFVGAGGAGVGVACLVAKMLQRNGVSRKDSYKKIYMTDINGLITKHNKGLMNEQKFFAKDMEPMKDLIAIVDKIKPNVIIGASAAGGIFNEKLLNKMAEYNERPVVFALSNPTSKAECTAEQAYKFTKGRVIYASGSPFPPVVYEGKTYKTGQGNNAYIFPGIALGIISARSHHVPGDIFLIAAQVTADYLDEQSLKLGAVYPPLRSIPDLSVQIGLAVAEYCFDKGIASIYPKPCDLCEWLLEKLYSTDYQESFPKKWKWPADSRTGSKKSGCKS